MNCSLPGSSVHGMSQARILEWVAISFSRRSSQTRDRTYDSRIAGGFFTTELQEEHKTIDISLHFCFSYLMLTHTLIYATIAQRETASTITHYVKHMYLFPYYFYNKVRDPMDCSLPGYSVHGIFQARVLEWGAIAFSNQIIKNLQLL